MISTLPRRPYSTRPLLSPRPVLALDLGGTQIRAAAVLPDGTRLARMALDTPTADGPAAILRACAQTLASSRAAAPGGVRSELAGVGISAPGPLDPWTGVIADTPNLGKDFRDIEVAAVLEESIGLPVYLERDTNVAALAEMAFGAGRDCRDFLYITVSTGVGGSIISDGRILHGPDGTAGELGHTPVSMEGPPCGCGASGHVEAFCSGTGLARAAREGLIDSQSPFLAGRAARARGAVTGRDVAEGDEAGDLFCRGLMERARRAFAVACVGFVNVFNPSRIVVGGSVAEHQGDRWLDPAREEVATYAFRIPRARVEIVMAELGGDVGLAGAQPLVTSRLGDPAWRAGRTELPASS